MTRYIGVDLHRNCFTVCVIAENGREYASVMGDAALMLHLTQRSLPPSACRRRWRSASRSSSLLTFCCSASLGTACGCGHARRKARWN